MTEKEYWLTCAGDEDFMRMPMPESVVNLSARRWHGLRYFDEPELSILRILCLCQYVLHL